MAQSVHEIDDGRDVDRDRKHPHERDAPRDLVDLEGNERARRDDGEILRPSLSFPEADAFDGEERPIEDGAEPERFRSPASEGGECIDEPIDEALAGRETEVEKPVRQTLERAMIEQAECAESKRDECDRLEELEHSDGQEPRVTRRLEILPQMVLEGDDVESTRTTVVLKTFKEGSALPIELGGDVAEDVKRKVRGK